MPTHHQSLGRYGEDLAARLLTSGGMVLLERNWRCELGEIDLVLRDGTTLVVCEVKTRSGSDYGGPHSALTATKLARLRTLTARWLADHDLRVSDVRIDLVAIIRPRRGPSVVDHVQGVG